MADSLPPITAAITEDSLTSLHSNSDTDTDEHDINFHNHPSNTVSSESLHDFHSFSLQNIQKSFDNPKSATFHPRTSSDTSDHELDDKVLFPGWRFGGHSITNDAKKEGFGFPVNEYGIPRRGQQSYLSDTAKDQYEHDVLQKYFKNGMLSTFKGREEMVISEAKVVAHKEIERLHAETHQTEKKLMRLEEELSRARVIHEQATSKLRTIITSITKIVQETQSWEISQNLPGGERARRQHRALSLSTTTPPFTLPDDPVLLLNRDYRALQTDYLQYQTMAAKSASLIPRLEAAVIPVQHELSALQIQRDRLRALEVELVEEEAKEFNEMQVVFKYRAKQAENKAEMAKRHAALAAEAERKKEEEERVKKESMEAKLSVKRKHLKARLKERLKRIRSEREALENHERSLQLKKQQAMSQLQKRVTQIRQDIEQHQLSEDDAVKPDVGSDESLAVSETRGKIYRKTMRNLQRRNVALREQEARKMQILGRLLQEEARRKV
ncbi:hypothetical protein HK097_004673, partial [Rhizophlyctis rosea]